MLLTVELADKKVWIAVGFRVLLCDAFIGRVRSKASLPEILPLGFYIVGCGQYHDPSYNIKTCFVLKELENSLCDSA